MSEQPESIKLKRITIKTESGRRWFDDSEILLISPLSSPVGSRLLA